MKLRFGTRSWLIAAWILIALLSGPAVVASVWLLAAIAAEAGFVVLPDGAPRFTGPQGREADVTELVATRDQTGGALGLFRQTIAPKSGPPMHIRGTSVDTIKILKATTRPAPPSTGMGGEDGWPSGTAASRTAEARSLQFRVKLELEHHACVTRLVPAHIREHAGEPGRKTGKRGTA
jgi:hypothetical protein